MGGGLTATLGKICTWRQYILCLSISLSLSVSSLSVACVGDGQGEVPWRAAPNSSWAICKAIKFDCFLARNVLGGKNCINKHFEAIATPMPPPCRPSPSPSPQPPLKAQSLISAVCYFVISWLRIYGFILSIFMCLTLPHRTSCNRPPPLLQGLLSFVRTICQQAGVGQLFLGNLQRPLNPRAYRTRS